MPVTNCFTVTAQETDTPLPSLAVAVMVQVPTETAVTTPLLFTVATLVLLLDHETDLLEALVGETVATICAVVLVFIFSVL